MITKLTRKISINLAYCKLYLYEVCMLHYSFFAINKKEKVINFMVNPIIKLLSIKHNKLEV